MALRAAVVALAIASSVAGPALAQPVARTRLAATTSLVARTVDELIKVPGGIAGYGVVIAAEGAPDYFLMRGVANALTKEPVTADTAFYIASQTKSYTGLLAAKLDREGVLPLDTTLGRALPRLRLPSASDVNTVTP